MAGVRRPHARALFGRAVRGGRVSERRLAEEGVAAILRARAAAVSVAPITQHNMRHRYISQLLHAVAGVATGQKRVDHKSVTRTASRRQPVMTVAEMRPSAKPPISCICRFSRGRLKRAAGESIATGVSCRKPAGYDQVTM